MVPLFQGNVHGRTSILRILMVSRGVVPIAAGCGGSELVAFELARILARSGHQITFLTDVADDEDASEPNLEFVPIESRLQQRLTKLPGGFFPWMLQHLVGNLTVVTATRRLTRERGYDLIHAHGNLSTILISAFSRLPLAYTEHDAPPWQCRYRRWWERLIRKTIYRALNVSAFRRADHVVATFDALRDELVERWGVPGSRVSVIPNGADTEIFHPVEARRRGADRYFLFVGRLTPRKGPDFVVRALAEVEDDVHCVFAGDGPMRGEIERLAEQLGVADRVTFLGNVNPEGLASVYANAELLVLPSVSEASPLVAAEAMACGTPVLATRIAGLPTLVEDWETGFLVHPDNVGELGVALRFLMRDGELRRTMSEKARLRAGQRFVWSRVGRNYEAVYRALVPERTDRSGARPAPRRFRRATQPRRFERTLQADVPEQTPQQERRSA